MAVGMGGAGLRGMSFVMFKRLEPPMRICSLAAAALLVATPAFAHPGHISAVAGHDHFVAIAAAGLAVAIVVGGLVARAQTKKR